MTGYAGTDFGPVRGFAGKKNFRAQWNLRLPWWFILCGTGIVVFYSVVPALLTYQHGEDLLWTAARGVIVGLFILLLLVLAVAVAITVRNAWVRSHSEDKR
jgi:H+/Cl- antiporter ClcA